MRLEFEIEDNVDEYRVTYSKIRIGNIPLPKGIIKPIVNLIVEQANIDVSQLNNEYLTVEVEELSAVVDKTALVDQLSDDPGTQAGLSLVFNNQLVTLDVFHEPIFWLNIKASRKIPFISVTLDVFQEPIVELSLLLNAFAKKNNLIDSSVTSELTLDTKKRLKSLKIIESN